MNTAKFNIIIPPQDIREHPACLAQIAAGDSVAFEWLYKNYCSKLYDYLLLLTTDKHLSEDLVQEVFLKIWTHREKLVGVENFNAYLYATAKNLLTDKWRKQQNEKQAIKHMAGNELQVEHNLYYHRHDEKQLHTAVKTLSPRQQLIYKLIREEGLTREQVSSTLHISPNTVKATMQNALGKIREELGGIGGF